MANNSPNGSRVKEENSSENSPLMNEKTRLANEITEALNESENVWRTVSDKQTILHRLYAEQIVVSDKFTEYNITWRNRDISVSENIETFHVFTEIDQQVRQLLQYLEDFEEKTKRAGKIIQDFIRDMKTHIATIKSSLETVINASSIESLTDVPVPTLAWIQSVPDPDIDLLADEWEQLQLNPGITHFLQQLRQLLHIGGGQNENGNELNDNNGNN